MQGVLKKLNGIGSWELMMANFNKGDWVEVSERIKWWKYWKHSNDAIPGNVCEVVEIRSSRSHQGVLFLKIRYKNKEAWALDSYCIKVEKYDIIYDESIKRACDQLQEHEKVCKKVRDDILKHVFSDHNQQQEEVRTDEEDLLYSDWEGEKTKECVPLPGAGKINTSDFVPTEWMTDEELDEYYEGLVEENV
jgi:hypothetical protein